MGHYRKLDPERITKTLTLLHLRIEERFPGAGLGQVCADLTELAQGAKQKAREIGEPNYWLRAGTMAIMLAGLAALYYVGGIIQFKRTTDNLFGVLQGIDSFVNLLIVMGAGVFFLTTLETRWKRRQALKAVHELRAIVHVIDMHQLTKDPSAHAQVSTPTPHSPLRKLTPYELMRYLDYSSEMLSLSAKVAELYAQSTRDPVVMDAVSGLGQMTTNLTNKIWQKITIIQANENWKSGLRDGAPKRAAKLAPGTKSAPGDADV